MRNILYIIYALENVNRQCVCDPLPLRKVCKYSTWHYLSNKYRARLIVKTIFVTCFESLIESVGVMWFCVALRILDKAS